MEPLSLQFIVKKLNTKEDPLKVHKTLGFLALASFVYRYFVHYPLHGDLGFGKFDAFAWLTIALHLALSTSALIFHVLARRILNTPVIIWEEYRLHAIVFTLKTCMVFAWAGIMRPWFGESFGVNTDRFAFFMLMIAHNMVVDEITRRYGQAGETTVRVKDDYHWARTLILRFYAYYQFCAMAACLAPCSIAGMADLGFNSLIAIQSSAFLMTLCRKGIITSNAHGIWYSFCLILSLYHIFRVHCTIEFFLATVAVFVARTVLHMNKYVIWTLFVFVPIGFAHVTDGVAVAEVIGAARGNIQQLLF